MADRRSKARLIPSLDHVSGLHRLDEVFGPRRNLQQQRQLGEAIFDECRTP
jgi:hypothetical protein